MFLASNNSNKIIIKSRHFTSIVTKSVCTIAYCCLFFSFHSAPDFDSYFLSIFNTIRVNAVGSILLPTENFEYDCGTGIDVAITGTSGFSQNGAGSQQCITLADWGIDNSEVLQDIPVNVYFDGGLNGVTFTTENGASVTGTIGNNLATATLPADGSSFICATVNAQNQNNADDMSFFAMFVHEDPNASGGFAGMKGVDQEIFNNCAPIQTFPININGDASDLYDLDFEAGISEVTTGDGRTLSFEISACGVVYTETIDIEPMVGFNEGFNIFEFTVPEVPGNCDEVTYEFCSNPGEQSYAVAFLSANYQCVPSAIITPAATYDSREDSSQYIYSQYYGFKNGYTGNYAIDIPEGPGAVNSVIVEAFFQTNDGTCQPDQVFFAANNGTTIDTVRVDSMRIEDVSIGNDLATYDGKVYRTVFEGDISDVELISYPIECQPLSIAVHTIYEEGGEKYAQTLAKVDGSVNADRPNQEITIPVERNSVTGDYEILIPFTGVDDTFGADITLELGGKTITDIAKSTDSESVKKGDSNGSFYKKYTFREIPPNTTELKLTLRSNSGESYFISNYIQSRTSNRMPPPADCPPVICAPLDINKN